MKNSIRHKLLVWLLVPLLGLSFLTAGCSYLLARHLTKVVFDKQLINSADSVASRVQVLGESVRVDLPANAEEIFSNNNKDAFFYQILSPDGRRLAGEPGMAQPLSAPAVGESPFFRDETVRGQDVRVAVIRMLAPESPMGSVVIQVAETMNSREELTGQILLASILPQLILIICAVVAVRIGISRGLLPLNKIRQAVDSRSSRDLSPIDDQSAPEEVKSLLTALNGLLYQAKTDIQRQQRFASNAAHQLRTPLAGLQTYLELIEKMSKDEEVDGMVHNLHSGVDRMIRTVQQLLSLSRAEYAATTSKGFVEIDLNTVVTDAATDIVPESIEREVELDFQSSESPAFINGDEISLKEMTTNLLENAIRYNSKGGQVKVAITNNGSVELVVEDDGVGIPEDERSRVFERFYRVSGTSAQVTGSGLGLSIVGEIARAHDAEVSIDAGSDGKGTRISIRFPDSSQAPDHPLSEPRKEFEK